MCLPSQEAVTAIFPFAAQTPLHPAWAGQDLLLSLNIQNPKKSGLHIGLGFKPPNIQEVKINQKLHRQLSNFKTNSCSFLS